MPYKAPRLLLARFPQVSARQKPQLWSGDSFTVVYEARQMEATPSMSPQGSPATVTAAYVRARASSSPSLLPIGGTGVFSADADILTGDTQRGDVISYTLPGSFTTQQGSYVLYITAEFDDGSVVTESRNFYVNGLGNG